MRFVTNRGRAGVGLAPERLWMTVGAGRPGRTVMDDWLPDRPRCGPGCGWSAATTTTCRSGSTRRSGWCSPTRPPSASCSPTSPSAAADLGDARRTALARALADGGLLVDAADVARQPRAVPRPAVQAPSPRPAPTAAARLRLAGLRVAVDADEPWRSAGLPAAHRGRPARRPATRHPHRAAPGRRRRRAGPRRRGRHVRAGRTPPARTQRRRARHGRAVRRRPARPRACAAWTPTPATPTRGTRWSSSSTRPCGAEPLRPAARCSSRWRGRCATW